MLLFHQQVFDEVIVGTSTTWYSSAEYNGLIGAADHLRVFAVATDISGTPTLKVYVDTSGDNENWYQSATANITASPTTSAPISHGFVQPLAEALASFARLRITLTGSGPPQCRLRLSVTGRPA